MTNYSSKLASAISIAEKVNFLRQAVAYPDRPQGVEVKETHHSWVFLTDLYAYKLKKPVVNEYYDFSSLENRHENCLDELRLNRRLAKGIYLATIPLTVDLEGRLHLGGRKEVVDWLVKMRRIPGANMLDASIVNQTATLEEIDRAATRLAEFYRDAPPASLEYWTQFRRLESEIQKSHQLLAQPFVHLATTPVEAVRCVLIRYLGSRHRLFQTRLAERKIVEGHGDLRPEHVCLRPEPSFIDCLEFSKRLRTLDTVDDLSTLVLECDRMGATYIGRRFLDKYTEVTGDWFPPSLFHFYKALRAFVKARLAAAHLLEARYQQDEKWIRRAGAYLAYARDLIPALRC